MVKKQYYPIQLQTGNVDNDHTLVTITDIESEAQTYATQLDMTRTEAFMKFASNIQNAQTKQKVYYDRKHSQAEFQLGNHASTLKKHEKTVSKRRRNGQ